MEVLYVLDFLSTLKIDSCNSITDVVMFDGALTVHIAGELFNIHYPKVSVMSGVEHTVSLFFNDVFKIPVVNQMITAHEAIYKLFGYGIYHNLIIYSNQNYMNLTIVTLVYSVAMIPK